MSRNQRHRPPLSEPNLQPLGSTSFSERCRPSPDHDLYGSYHLSSSSQSSPPLSTHSILSSCDLEPLNDFPEDALTVESLPQLLHQIKSNRNTLQPPPASWSHLPRSANQPANMRDLQDRCRHPRIYGSVSQKDSPPSSSSYYDVDTMLASSGHDAQQGRPAKNIPSLFSLPGPANRFFVPPMERQLRTGWEQGLPEASSNKFTGGALPCKREAQDFQGTAPGTYPYSCSLCNVTVLSKKNWKKHISNPHHADRQLRLLQRFPMWDCRMETVNSQSKKKREDRSQSRHVKSVAKKAASRSNVVCVKFPAQSVEESYLRKLAEPFGRVTNILVFSSLAFLEMDFTEQAKELVKSHNQNPPNVNGQKLDFSISNSFNFVKNCRILHFTPPPEGDDDRLDLLSVVKRFGPPFYTLFLPSGAFIEMKSLKDARKLVDYYSSNTLKINDKVLQVSFSAEYSSLTKAPSAQRYEEESTKRTRSRHEDTLPSDFRKRRKEEHRSKSREKKARSKSQERKDRSSGSISKITEEEKTATTESSSDSAAGPLKTSEDGHDKDCSFLDGFSEEEGDLEGMEVVGEDGQDLEADDMETLEEAEEEMEKEQEADMEDHLPQPEGDKKEEDRHSNSKEKTKDEEAEVPVSIEDCMTVDKVGREPISNKGKDDDNDDEDSQNVSRVVFFNNLPLRYCNRKSFINLSKRLGRQVRYILLHGQRKGFMEMSSTPEAVRVANKLNVFFKNTRTIVLISNKYRRLTKGYRIHAPDQPMNESSRGRDQHKDSGTKDKEESRHRRRKSSRSSQEEEREDSNKKAHEKQSASRNTSERETKSHKRQQIESEDTQKKQSSARNTSAGDKTQDDLSDGRKTPENESGGGKSKIEPRKTPDALQKCGETPDREGVSSKASEDICAIKHPEITDSRKQDQSRQDGLCEMLTGTPPLKDDPLPLKTSQTLGESPEKHGQNPSEAQAAALIDKSHQEAAYKPSCGPASSLQPVGTEFVRPVVGYFCNLCQLIYADEDEAKVQHCSSRRHHDKYQERMKMAS